MTRAGWLALLAMTACTPRPGSGPPPQVAGGAAAACRSGPDGARPVTDRGIGGTGTPATQLAERGIGGTGIIGVITGFASICLAGQEVALPPSALTEIDGEPAVQDTLRTGQLVALEAAGPEGALQAVRITALHAVIGPVERIGPGTMTVAGQLVFTTNAMGAAVLAQPGDWVAVSGLQQTENTIMATRIDPAVPGRVLVRGALISLYGSLRIGALRIRLPDGSHPPGGWPVIAIGHLQDGVLVADSLQPDAAAEGPSAYFGPSIDRFIVESYVAVVAGGYLVGRDFVAGDGYARAGTHEHAIASFHRGAGGELTATGLRLSAGAGERTPAGFTPAPVPGGRFDRGGSDDGRRSLQGGYQRGGRGFGSPGSGSPGFGGPAFGGQGSGSDGGPGSSGPPRR